MTLPERGSRSIWMRYVAVLALGLGSHFVTSAAAGQTGASATGAYNDSTTAALADGWDDSSKVIAEDSTATGGQALPSADGNMTLGAQSISLPSGAGTPLGMGESFSAQLSTGLATYSVPIGLPKARGGIQPSLALGYSSSGGPGIAGMGWSIGGSAIARKTDHGMPTYDDRDAWHPNQDRFVFGGAELVPICQVVGGACNGSRVDEVMPAWADGWQYFRTENEGGFSRVFWSPDRRTWRVQAKDGTNLEFGVPLDGSNYTGALEANPSRSSEVVRWHLVRQYDSHGSVNGNGVVSPYNFVLYRYLTDGNVVYLSDIYDTTPVANPTSRETSQFAHHTHLSYERRPDTLVSFRSGWRMDHRLRIHRIDVTTKPFDSSSAARQLVRRYHFGYDWLSHVSLLTSFQQEGRCQSAVSEGATGLLPDTSCSRLPALRFEYQRVESELPPVTDSAGLHYEPFFTTLSSLPNSPPHSLGQMETGILDVNGDSLPDVLVAAASLYEGAHGLYLNGASGTLGFANAQQMQVVGSSSIDAGILKLTNKHVSVLDLDADGRINLVHMPNYTNYSVFSPMRTGDGWAWSAKGVSALAGQSVKIDWTKNSKHTVVADVNGDGLVDIVYAGATELQTFFSLGRYPGGQNQFGHGTWTGATTASLSTEPIASCMPWSATPVRFGAADVQLAEMNGDGLPDIVRIRDGQVVYWPGRGNGTWGTGERHDCLAGTFGTDRGIYMESAPVLSPLESSTFQMSDVNGDGLSDLVKIRTNAVDVYLNENGLGFTSRGTIPNTPAHPNGSRRVALTDIDGSGTPDLLWGEANNYQYLDLTGGVQPYVLRRVHNGLGATTELEYSTSSRLMLAAEASGDPWDSVIPNVVPVVVRSTVRDNLHLVGRPLGTIVTEYEYRNPVFDGKARDFLGFREATVRHIGDSVSPTSIERSEFLLGHWSDDESATSAPEEKEPWRAALKGLPVVEEEVDANGVAKFTKHTTVSVERLYTGLDGRNVFARLSSTIDTFAYDTDDFDRAASSTTLTDYAVNTGSGQRTSNRNLPLRSTRGRAQLRSSVYQDSFGNVVSSVKNGCVAGCPNGPDEAVIVTSSFARPTGDLSGWMWRETESAIRGGSSSAYRHHRGSTYNAIGEVTESHAWLSGSQALQRSTFGAPNPPTASGGESEEVLVSLGTTEYDTFGNPTLSHGPYGACHAIATDSLYAEFVTEDLTFAGEVDIDGCGTNLYTTTSTYDRGFGLPTRVVSPRGQPSAVTYDGFGRVIATFGPSAAAPGSLDITPRTQYEYHPTADPTVTPYSYTRTQSVHESPSGAISYVEDVAYYDGLSRAIFAVSEVDPDEGDKKQCIVSGGAQYTAKGIPYLSHEPEFHDGPAVGFNLAYQPSTPTKRQRYDAFGRVTEVVLQDNLVKSTARYHALSGDSFDAGDLSIGTVYTGTYSTQINDGHGRTVSNVSRFRKGSNVEEHYTETQYLPSGEVASITQRRTGSPSYTRWFEYDSWGRLVHNVEPNTSVISGTGSSQTIRAWRYAYDDASRLVGTSDANGCGSNYFYDSGGRLIGSDYSPCKANHEPYTSPDLATGENLETFYRYDTPDPDAGTPTDPLGESLPIDERWLVGRLVSARSRGGFNVFAYDSLGRTQGVARRVARPNAAGDNVDERYAPRWYIKKTAYDFNDRPIRVSTGAPLLSLLGQDGTSELRLSYTRRGLVRHVGSSYGNLIGREIRDARGLVEEVVFGDAAQTRRSFSYNDLTQLVDVTTYRAPPSLWSSGQTPYIPPGQNSPTTQLTLEHTGFQYDVMGNLERADDYRPPEEWTDNSRPVRRQWQYDSYSRLTHTTYTYAGTSTWQSPFAAENADPSRPQPSPHVAFDSRVIDETFEYDGLNNLTSNTDNSKGFYDRSIGTASFAIASQPHKLTSASNRGTGSTRQGELAVAYDDVGQVTAMVLQRDGQCLPAGASCWSRYAYEWDEVGNLTRARRWDLTASERLSFGTAASVHGDMLAEDAHPARAPEVEMRYQYDGGSRVTKTVTRADAAAIANAEEDPTKHTVYVFSTLELRSTPWVGDGAAADYELSSETTEVRLAAGSVMGRLVSNGVMPRTGQSQQHLLLTFSDQLGSATFTIDHATSELVEYVTYTAYGQTESDYRTDRWDNNRNPTRFTGKEEDIEVGLNYHGSRYYSPALKRWMSADPETVHSAGSDINPWAYGYGNPTAYVDPDGRLPVLAVLAIVGAVISSGAYCYENGFNLGSGSWWAGLGIAAGAGALSGLAGGLAGGAVSAGLGASAGTLSGMALTGMASGAASGYTSYATQWGLSSLAGQNTSGYGFGGLLNATAVGGLMGAGTGAATWGVNRGWDALARAQANEIESNAASAAQGEAAGESANAASKTAQAPPGPVQRSLPQAQAPPPAPMVEPSPPVAAEANTAAAPGPKATNAPTTKAIVVRNKPGTLAKVPKPGPLVKVGAPDSQPILNSDQMISRAAAPRGPAATLEAAQRIGSLADGPPWSRTVVLLETQEGPTLAGGGATDLNPAQKALAQELGYTVAPDFPGIHAEGTVLNGAGQLGLTPTTGVATNNVCSGICSPMIRGMGGWVSGKWFGF